MTSKRNTELASIMGVNECWFGDAEEAVKKFGSLYEQYVREFLAQKEQMK